ncbi:MAG: hypothetical protein GY698_01760, partial [Actinomycetia bacterium]|nr:hypothetical protein [Actinomycetes bacterium]
VGRGISSSIPSWSHDGSRLAWTETNRAEGPSVVTSRVDRRETTRDPLPLEPFYVSWNPTDTHIAVLGHSATGRGVGVAVSELADRNTLPVELDAAPSYYLSWAADGEQFLAKRGIADLTVVGIGGRSTVLVEPTGRGQAPIWLEDGRLIGIEATDRSRALVIASSGQVIGSVLETDPAVGMVFTADPTGRWLAIQALAAESLLDPAKDAIRSSDGSEPEGELLIVDLSNGRPVWRTGVRGQSWVWAPDGQSLLILTTEGPNDEGPLIVDSVIWHLPTPGSGEEPDLISGPSFEPTDRFVQEWMPFFDQYVQDMTLWSPDSSGWTFAGRPVGDREGQPGIHVVGAGPGDEPVRVGDGQMSVWAPTAGGGGGAAPSPA